MAVPTATHHPALSLLRMQPLPHLPSLASHYLKAPARGFQITGIFTEPAIPSLWGYPPDNRDFTVFSPFWCHLQAILVERVHLVNSCARNWIPFKSLLEIRNYQNLEKKVQSKQRFYSSSHDPVRSIRKLANCSDLCSKETKSDKSRKNTECTTCSAYLTLNSS